MDFRVLVIGVLAIWTLSLHSWTMGWINLQTQVQGNIKFPLLPSVSPPLQPRTSGPVRITFARAYNTRNELVHAWYGAR